MEHSLCYPISEFPHIAMHSSKHSNALLGINMSIVSSLVSRQCLASQGTCAVDVNSPEGSTVSCIALVRLFKGERGGAIKFCFHLNSSETLFFFFFKSHACHFLEPLVSSSWCKVPHSVWFHI